jgi:hypothetical protein
MTADSYLINILGKYSPTSLSLYGNAISTLHSSLRTWANGCYVDLKTSGSIAKGTAISLSSDADYLVSLTHDCNGTLSQIFNSLHDHLGAYYSIRRQNVSIGINLNGLKVDVAAAKKRPGNTNFHSIYVSKKDSWAQTNIQVHINEISKSGRLNEIKLLKIWRELNHLEFPSIYIEYLLINFVLKHKAKNDLANNFFHVLSELAKNENNVLFARLVDPANSNNILSDLMTIKEKQAIVSAARKSVKEQYWGSIVY